MSSNNTAGHIGREITVQALGQSWTFSRWSRKTWVDFVTWAKSFLPDPIKTSLDAIEEASIRDGRVLRQLSKDDAEEIALATKEKRQPILMAGQYKPVADVLIEKAQELAGCYLDFMGKPIQSLLTSPVGASYACYLLLRVNHDDIDEETAYDIMLSLPTTGAGSLQDVFNTVQGRTPGSAPKNAEGQAA